MRRTVRCLLLLPGLVLAGSGVVNQTFDFTPGDLVFDRANGYDVVALPGQYWTSEPGNPNLPLAVYNVLIPPDAEVTSVEIRKLDVTDLPGEFDVHPTQKPVPIPGQASSLKPQASSWVAPNPATYASDAPYPAQVVEFARSGCLGGYRIAGLQVTPLQYIPARKQLRLIRHLEVALHYETGRHEVLTLDPSQVELMNRAAGTIVRNPKQTALWRPNSRSPSPVSGSPKDDWLCDLLIITSNSLVSSFQPYVDWKAREGFKTLVVTTESIHSTYSGRDEQEKIRNCVIDYWQNHGLKWLLLGGDDQIVPVRLARQTVEGNVGDIATDFYYSDLQYSWDSNQNNLFGEMDDSMDLFTDVYVGRWTADNASDVALFFAKDTMYERHPDTNYIKKVLFGSIMLWSPYHGRLINHIIADRFPSDWRFAHLEDPDYGVYAESLDAGYQFSHVAAHGNQTTFSVMDASEAPGLTNGFAKLNFVNAIACESGWFDGGECLAEALLVAPHGGCIATLLNSRYGFGYPPAFGPSDMLDLQFYVALLNHEATRFADLNAASKDHFHSLTMDQEAWRWCVYELNLLGDPTLQPWLDKPHTLSVTRPGSIPTGPQTCRIAVEDAGRAVPNALVCLSKGSETYARGFTNSQGWVDLLVNPQTAGDLHVCVTAQNSRPKESDITVTGSTSAPALVFSSLRIDDPDANGRLEPGETADVYVSLTNSGAANATSVQAVLRPFTNCITLLDSISNYGTIAAGATVEGTKFRLTAPASVAPGTKAEFTAHCTSGQGTWDPYFSFPVGPVGKPRSVWSDHDVGNMILTVTSVGSIGSTGPYKEGSGLKYPRNASNGSLYFTSLACSNGPNYVVDRWYGHPSSTYNTDWKIVDTLHAVIPPVAADQEFEAVFNDSGLTSPKGLTVTQWSGSMKRDAYQDFVVMNYTLENKGDQALDGLYVGVLSDFDVNNTTTNDASTDNNRSMAWMTDNSTWVGVKLLNPNQAANVSVLDNARYVDPSGMTSEAVKDSFLRGVIHSASGSGGNYSVVVSAGPFDLAPGARRNVAIAFVGGMSQAELQQHADSAQSWFDLQMPMGVTYLRSRIDDSGPGGNSDGILNPGESVSLPLWVSNRADRPAQGVWATLRKTSADTLLTITDSVRYIGTLAAGDSGSTGSNGFKLRVAQACTNGYFLPMTLVCRDTLDSVSISSPGIRVGAPQLAPGGILCWDPPPGGNNNGRLDPGEQAQLAVGLTDLGLGDAESVSVRLVSGDSRLLVLDSLGVYGRVPRDSTVYNSSDRFEVRAGNMPPETQIPCTLYVAGARYQAKRFLLIPVGVMSAADPIPDGPRTPALYYAYDNGDTNYVFHPAFNWVEISGAGTHIPYASNDDVHLVDLPPGFGPFRFYGQSFSQVSISADGWICPGNHTATDYSNTEIPAPTTPPGMICANWDDLYPDYNNAGFIYYYHDAANHRFVIEYDSVPYYAQTDVTDKFEVIISDSTVTTPSGDNDILVQYQTANGFTSSTLGIEDPSQTIAIQALYNGTYHRGCAPIAPGRAIRYTTDYPAVEIRDAGVHPECLVLALRSFPNPLREAARISLSLPKAGRVKLVVLDITGRRIRALADDRFLPGNYSLRWNRADDLGRKVSAGVYVYRLETAAGTLNVKTVVLN